MSRDKKRKRTSDAAWALAHPDKKREAARRYRQKRGPERGAEYNREWRRKNIIVAMVSAARRRARREGKPFDPEILDELKTAGIPVTCPVYGIALVPGSQVVMDGTPSLDCVCPDKGYVGGNVRVISWLANRHKNSATAEQHEAIARYMRSPLNGGVSALEIG